jgi:Carboxypeptidase regulatory-like domain
MVPAAFAQKGKICGIVQDQTGASVVGAALEVSSSDTRLEAKTSLAGKFCFDGIPPGEYELSVRANGFRTDRRKVTASLTAPVYLTISLGVETAKQQVTVIEGPADVTSLNVAQTQIGTGLIENLTSESVNAQLSSILTLATPGVAADSNGVFHPLGEHAETSFSVDGQTISDQQSRMFFQPELGQYNSRDANSPGRSSSRIRRQD